MGKGNSIIKHLDFTIIDIFCLSISFFIACLIKFDGAKEFFDLYLKIYLLMLLVDIVYTLLANPYKDILRRDAFSEFRCSFYFIFINMFLTILSLYAFKVGSNYSRLQLVYTYILYFLFSTTFRILWKEHIKKVKKTNKTNLFVITEGKDLNKILFNIENSEFSEYSIKGICVLNNSSNIVIEKYTKIDLNDNLVDFLRDNNVNEVFAFCKPEEISGSIINKIVNDGIQFHITIDKIFDFEADNVELNNIAMYRTLNYNVFSFSARQMLYDPFKRFLDIIISLFACFFLVPIYLFIKICYVLDGDRAPILYKHIRIGKDGKEFYLHKFRSMVPDADEILNKLLQDEDRRKEWDENHKFDDDPRITKLGHFIRKTSIDEFPQFINVLKGDMSIIGPRPLVPGELKSKNGLSLYEKVKPGITGWWACNGRSNISYEERLELEYYYVKNYSFGLDLTCILKTMFVVLFRKGAK